MQAPPHHARRMTVCLCDYGPLALTEEAIVAPKHIASTPKRHDVVCAFAREQGVSLALSLPWMDGPRCCCWFDAPKAMAGRDAARPNTVTLLVRGAGLGRARAISARCGVFGRT